MSEVSLSELDCLEDFLTPSQDLSQCRSSFGAHLEGVCIELKAMGDPVTCTAL